MPDRQHILHTIAEAIMRLPSAHVVRVGIDGIDGAGKSMFGDELAQILTAGRSIIRASVDGFHNPRAIRYRLGRQSPEGYFRDAYNYEQLKALLLNPLSPGGTGRYRTAAFDYRTDQPVIVPEAQATPGDILVFDGIFLHRPELRGYWDYSVFLEVGVAVSMARCAKRDATSPDPQVPDNRRYVEGQQLYLRTCTPSRHATVVINNEVLESPRIVTVQTTCER
jgi:uridine kinase